MSLSTWLAFFAASWAISFSPGPGAISAMSSGLKYGFRRGYWTTIGLILGILIQFCVVAIGLGAVLATSEVAFTVLKWIGAAYLVYLGWLQMRSDAAPVAVEAAPPADFKVRELILRGCLVNITNPKGTVFLMAVVPQFLNTAAPLPIQYAIIASTLCFTDLVAMGCYTTLAARVLRLLRSPGHIRFINRSFGALFILAGTVLATFSRRA
jgi:Putative threonine efflux protein